MEASDLDLLKEVYLVRRVGSTDRVETIFLESIDYLDNSFKFKGHRYGMDAFDVWKYVAPYDKDTDYIRFFAHIGHYMKEIERERLVRECESLVEGIRANLSTNTASLYAIHNLLSTSVELLERNPMLYRAKPQKTVYEVKDGD